ncbi:MAG: hypothetical protein AB7S78_03360 [Candidatus Omnitrophota bacterium]
MKSHSGRSVYILIFSLSFFILSLQIYLSSLLRFLVQLPFYAISFAFLGLSSAGVFTFIYFNKKQNRMSPVYLAGLFHAFNLSLLFYALYGVKISRYFGGQKSNFFSTTTSTVGFSQLLDFILVDIILNSLYYGLFISICFFFLGAAMSYLYKMHSQQAPKIYLFDLLGASTGCILGNVMIKYVQFSSIPLVMCFLSALLPLIILKDAPKAKYSRYLTILILVMSAFTIYLNKKTSFLEFNHNPHLSVLDYKMEDDVEELWHSWNEYSRLSLIRHKKRNEDHTRHMFSIDGGSGNAHLFAYDADNPFNINIHDTFTPVSLPYLLNTPQNMLIMFVGAGIDMIQANSFSRGQTDITGVELNPLIVNTAVSLPEFHLKQFFAKDNIHIHIQEGRNFLESNAQTYDAIVYSWAGASFSNYLGTSGYTGRFLYTTEAMKSVMNHLKPNGTISIVNSNKLRLAAVMKKAFEELGHKNFAEHILILERKSDIYTQLFSKGIYSSLNNQIIFFKNSPFSSQELKTVVQNALSHDLEIIYTPDYIHPDYTIYTDVIRSRNTDQTMKDLSRLNKIDLTISSDDKPFIENMFYPMIIFSKDFWMNLDKIAQRESTKQYSLNLYTFWFIVFLILAAFVLIILPLILTRQITMIKSALPYLYYFSILGVGFILIEIAMMNKFILFLGNPIYSFTLILASLLASTGIGSYMSNGLFEKGILSIRKSAVMCSLLLVGYFFLMPFVLNHFLGISFALKLGITFLILLPLGMCLGMMFPQGLKKLAAENNDLVPWAWGLNGYMSTVGSAVSIYMSMMFGFSWFILIAAGLYLSLIFVSD